MTLETGVKALAEAVAVDVKALEDGKASTTDPRFTDAREWSAATISQAEVGDGTATTRRAFTAQRLRQGIAAWHTGISGAIGRTILGRSTAAQVRGDLGLGTAATKDVGLSTGQVMEVGAFGLGHTFSSQVFDANEIADLVDHKSGFYPYISDIGSTNTPSTFVYINQLFLGSDLGLVQIAYGVNTDTSWIRTRLGSVWTPWAKQLSTGDIGETAGQVMAVGTFGYGGVNPTNNNYDANDLPAGQRLTWSGSFTEADAIALNLPALGGSGTTARSWQVECTGVLARLVQTATEVFGVGTIHGRTFTRVKHDSTWHPWQEVHTTGNTLNIGTTAATARTALELTGEWVDLRPHLKTGFYWDTTREGKNAHPRIRKLSCGRVELDGIVSFNETSGPTPNGVFVNVPTPFRPQLTAVGLAFADTATPLSFGQCNWIVGGEVAYGGALVHGDVSMIPVGLPPTTQDGALSLSGMYWFT